MKEIEPSCAGDYAIWYLNRERSKGNESLVPTDHATAIAQMWSRHSGKWRDWYDKPTTRWSIVSLDLSEFENLVFLDVDWTKTELLTYDDRLLPNGSHMPNDARLLRGVAERAIAVGYLSRAHQRIRDYYQKLQLGLRLTRDDRTGDNRIVIRSLEPNERQGNPSGSYYLQDGNGRCLPYAILIHQGKLSYEPVEAFLADRSPAPWPA
jgi:hypothetical protein